MWVVLVREAGWVWLVELVCCWSGGSWPRPTAGTCLLPSLCAHCPPSLPHILLCPRSLVSEALGVVLPSTFFFDYPTIEALCAYILASQVRLIALSVLLLRRCSDQAWCRRSPASLAPLQQTARVWQLFTANACCLPATHSAGAQPPHLHDGGSGAGAWPQPQDEHAPHARPPCHSPHHFRWAAAGWRVLTAVERVVSTVPTKAVEALP